MVERRRPVEHVVKIANLSDIPTRNVLVERIRVVKQTVHARHRCGLPPAYVLIKRRFVFEQIIHRVMPEVFHFEMCCAAVPHDVVEHEQSPSLDSVKHC